MKLAIVAGTAGAGKTSIILHTIRELRDHAIIPAIVKIDCLQTDDKRRFEREQVPIKVGLSADMCPDHFAIYNMDNILIWGTEQNASIVIMETAGLCLRCSPYTDKCLAICIIDVTTGPNAPLKIGPLLTTADIVVTTKGDLVSQAEREVFREKIYEANKKCKIVEANGLSGMGASELAKLIIKDKQAVDEEMILRHTPPLAVCTLCTGELRTSKKYHCGVLRNIEGQEEYLGE